MTGKDGGTRFTAECGHSWTRKPPRLTVTTLSGSLIDCPQCGDEMIIPEGQFKGLKSDDRPETEVQCVEFHKWLNKETEGHWPSDGAGTFSAGF